MPSTTPANSPPPAFELALGDGATDRLTRIGPGLWGYVYRSLERPACYRLVPIEQAPLEQREGTRKLLGSPRRLGIAPVIGTDQKTLNDRTYFVVQHEIQPECHMADVLTNPDPILRLAFAVQILKALPGWRAHLHHGLLPMPAEILFAEALPYLLAVPDLPAPGLDAVWEVPERGLYLPPELVRGRDKLIWSAHADIYALGVTLLRCFFEVPLDSAELTLTRVANGSIFSSPQLTSRLPFWLERLDLCREVVPALRQWLDPDSRFRSSADPQALAAEIEQCLSHMEPSAAVAELRNAGRAAEALELLDDVVLEQPSYELLLLASRIALEDLHQPLQTIDRYEQAIQRYPERLEAYRLQFGVIAASRTWVGLLMLVEGGGRAPEQLDEMIRRDFARLSDLEQEARELALARYLMWRKQYGRAAEFIFPRLFKNGAYAWWKHGMALSYAAMHLARRQLPEAEAQLRDIAERLAYARRIHSLSEEELGAHSTQLAELSAERDRLRRSVVQQETIP